MYTLTKVSFLQVSLEILSLYIFEKNDLLISKKEGFSVKIFINGVHWYFSILGELF